MRLFVIILYAFFVITPIYLFNTLVLPELNSLNNIYAHADQIAQQVSGVPDTTFTSGASE